MARVVRILSMDATGNRGADARRELLENTVEVKTGDKGFILTNVLST